MSEFSGDMKRNEVLRALTLSLEGLGIDDAHAEARHSLAWAEGCELIETMFPCGINRDTPRKLEIVISRRSAGEPLAYIMGERWFMGMRFEVSNAVLIPRQDTEVVCECALDFIKNHSVNTALDMCTGSGAIAVSLAVSANISVTATDISRDALSVAKANARSNDANVKFVHSDLFENVTGTFDVIVSNPPYISDCEYKTLACDVRDYEPKIALCAGDDGLGFYRRIIKYAPRFLNPKGALILEIGYDQKHDVTELMTDAGFSQITCHKDLARNDRCVFGILK